MIDCLHRIHLVWRDVADTTITSYLVGKVYKLCRVSNYSNSRVHGHGRVGLAILNLCLVLFSKHFQRKEEFLARRKLVPYVVT